MVDPCIDKVHFERVLVDGGSSINLLFRNTLKHLKLTTSDLLPYDAQFWGVLPGQSSTPLGQITLPVQFGTADHFRMDYVNFIVADFNSTYHAILGRPALTKFMAIPHYTYLILKMPTEQGVLTIKGNVYTAYTCEAESCEAAETAELSKRLDEIKIDAAATPPENLEIPPKERPRKMNKSNYHKTIQLCDDDPSKTALIGAHLDPK